MQQDLAKAVAPKSSRAVRSVAAVAVAAAFGAAAVAATLGQGTTASKNLPTDGSAVLTLIPQDQLEAALQTVDPAQRPAIEEEIRSCKRRATQMQIGKIPGATGPSSGMIQVRSGTYLSPPFKITDYPVTFLVPTPELGDVGRGYVEYLGVAENVRLELTPYKDVPSLTGVKRVDVIWDTTQPCAITKG